MAPTRKARFKRRYVGLRPWTRHSMVLLVAGFVYVAYGMSLLIAPDNEARARSLIIALEIFPIWFWGSLWIATGLMSIISSRWPPVTETWGYMALTGLSAGWSASFLFGVLWADAPINNLGGFIVWGLVAFVWWAISGLLNPDHTGVVSRGPS